MLESKTLVIRIISPVFIQGQNAKSGQGYLERDTYSSYAIDGDNLVKYLYDQTGNFDIINELAKEIVKKRGKNDKDKIFNYKKFLLNHDLYFINEMKRFKCFKSIINSTPKTNDRFDFINNIRGFHFVPGSSIKGAIRSAIVWKMASELKSDEQQNLVKDFIVNCRDKIDDFIKQYGSNSNKKRDFSKKINSFIFTGQSKFKVVNDFMKCFKVKDSYNLENGIVESFTIKSMTLRDEMVEETTQSPIDIEDSSFIGVLQRDGFLCVNYKGKQFQFRNKVEIKHFQELENNIGKKIRVHDYAGQHNFKISNFEILEEEGVAESLTIDKKMRYKAKFVSDPRNNEPLNFTINALAADPVNPPEIDIQLTLDTQQLEKIKTDNPDLHIPFNNLNDILSIVSEYYRHIWNEEKQFLELVADDANINLDSSRYFYNTYERENMLRLGWGIGLASLPLFTLMEEKDKTYIRNKFYHDRGELPAPKSKKFVFDQDDNKFCAPLGWTEIAWEHGHNG